MRKFIMTLLVSLLIVLTILLIWFGLQPTLEQRDLEQPADIRLLFVGNSFTGNNELDQLVANLMENLGPEWEDVYSTRIAPGGYKFINHLRDVENAAANPTIHQLLVSGSDTARDWDFILIQEQSQILGFNAQQQEKVASFGAAAQLNQYARSTGATVMLMQTWGYADGDPNNSSLFPDYVTMQNQLTQGTFDFSRRMSANGNRVFVVPAGRGFQLVYQDLLRDGQDPLAQGSLFRELYAEDSKHPSLSGSYLAACVVTAVYTGQPVTEIEWTPRGLDAAFAAYLREITDRVVFGDEFPAQTYPWSP